MSFIGNKNYFSFSITNIKIYFNQLTVTLMIRYDTIIMVVLTNFFFKLFQLLGKNIWLDFFNVHTYLKTFFFEKKKKRNFTSETAYKPVTLIFYMSFQQRGAIRTFRLLWLLFHTNGKISQERWKNLITNMMHSGQYETRINNYVPNT